MENQNNDTVGMRLLEKGKRGIWRTVFSRGGMFTILLLIQLAVLISIFGFFSDFTAHYYIATIVLYGGTMMYLINSRINPTAKITWLVLIMLVPVFGVGMLIYTKADVGHRAVKARVEQLIAETDGLLCQNPAVADDLKKQSPETAALSNYINRAGCFPVYEDTYIKYFPQGEDKFDQLLIVLE